MRISAKKITRVNVIKVITNFSELPLSIITVAAVGLASLKMRIIDRTGFAAAMLIGALILFCGGLQWFTLLLVFYFSAAYFTKYKYERKLKLAAAEAKGGARGWHNVLSNGAIAAVSAVLYRLTADKAFAAAYLGAVATSVADTLATEVGLLNPGEPRLLTNLRRKVRAGTSGGVTLLGESASLLGTFVLAFAALLVGFEGLGVTQILISSLLAGFLGCNFDSLLGATVQAGFKCRVCGKATEEKTHCGQSAERLKGIGLVDNNMVNLASTIFGAAIAMRLYIHVL